MSNVGIVPLTVHRRDRGALVIFLIKINNSESVSKLLLTYVQFPTQPKSSNTSEVSYLLRRPPEIAEDYRSRSANRTRPLFSKSEFSVKRRLAARGVLPRGYLFNTKIQKEKRTIRRRRISLAKRTNQNREISYS